MDRQEILDTLRYLSKKYLMESDDDQLQYELDHLTNASVKFFWLNCH